MLKWIKRQSREKEVGSKVDHLSNFSTTLVPAEIPLLDSTRFRQTAICGGQFLSAEQIYTLNQIWNDSHRRLLPSNSKISWVGDTDDCEYKGRRLDSAKDWLEIAHRGELSQIVGAYAIAWTTPTKEICLARDAIGERSIYYSVLSGGGFVFSTRLRDLLDTDWIQRKIHLPFLSFYLSCAFVPGNNTLVEGVYELLPGTMLKYDGKSLKISEFWSLPTESDLIRNRSEQDLREELQSRLESAVKRRLPLHGAIGASLSGGIDSSLIVALLKKHYPGEINSYSLCFGANYANELEYSNLVAKHCGVNHEILELSPEIIANNIDTTIGMLSQPNGDPLTVPNAILFAVAAQKCKVVFNGEGGDPCFGGPKNIPMVLAELYSGASSIASDLSGEDRARSQAYLRSHLKCYDDLEMIFSKIHFPMANVRAMETYFENLLMDSRWQNLVNRLQAINIYMKGAHHILPKVDQLSYCQGVFPKSPLFDRPLVEFAMKLDSNYKQCGSIEKYLLKQASSDLLPNRILERPKSGMLVPVEGWFHGPLKTEAKNRLLDSPILHSFIQKNYLEQLTQSKLGGLRPRHGAKIWLLITLEAWLRSYQLKI